MPHADRVPREQAIRGDPGCKMAALPIVNPRMTGRRNSLLPNSDYGASGRQTWRQYALDTPLGRALAKPIRHCPTLIRSEGHCLFAPRRDRGRYQHEFEERTMAWLRQRSWTGKHIVDVGAAVGELTLSFSKQVGPKGAVIAIEPSPRNRMYLHLNLALNRISNVEVIAAAAGASEGWTGFNLTESSDSHSFYDHPLITTRRRIVVRCIALDSLHEKCDLVKVDVEGAELDVLQGATRIVADGIPLIVELAPACQIAAGRQPRDLIEFLLSVGYSITVLDECYNRVLTGDAMLKELDIRKLPPNWYANLVCVRGHNV